MTTKNHALLMFVSPVKLVPECPNPGAGVQFGYGGVVENVYLEVVGAGAKRIAPGG
jgi:hypothetical protein